MKRIALIIKQSDDGSRCIAIDEENAEELLRFFRQNKLTYKEINIIHRVANYEYQEIK